MAIKIFDIDQQQFIYVLKDCHLCGSSFKVPIENADTICPECKELWKEFIGSRNINLSVKINTDGGAE